MGAPCSALVLDFQRRVDLPDADTWIEWGALLDKFYIPTHYPNGLPDLTLGQTYRKQDAERGIDASRKLVSACQT